MSKHYIAPLSDNIERTSVFYKNRYGFTLAGDLYHLKNLDKNKQYPALIVGAPYGGVKEQGPCIYANELAKRGFIVLTFDPCFMGESEGYPRHVSSPDIFTENFSAGVDYLGLLPFVNREQIGAIGICGSGGFALSATQMDTRIKAVATASMYDMTVASRLGMDKETIDNLFTPFYSKKSFGTGLGLCLSKEIIELHNGTIKYTSKLNLYTEVKIVIPVY